MIDACSRISAEQEVPDTGSVEGDVTAILANIAHLLYTARMSSVLPSIVDVAERDPEFADIHSAIQHGHADPLRDVLTRAVDRGELAPTADRSAMVAALLGPLFYRRWFSREPVDDRFIHTIAAGVIDAQRPIPTSRPDPRAAGRRAGPGGRGTPPAGTERRQTQ